MMIMINSDVNEDVMKRNKKIGYIMCGPSESPADVFCKYYVTSFMLHNTKQSALMEFMEIKDSPEGRKRGLDELNEPQIWALKMEQVKTVTMDELMEKSYKAIRGDVC